MKFPKFILSLFLFFTIISISNQYFAQCKEFAVTTCKPELYPFIHDGIFNSPVVSSGESVELYKTFFKGQNYRLLICKAANLPDVELTIMDTKRNQLYTGLIKDDVYKWDFNLQSSQQLIISINVSKLEKPESGCISLLVGIEDNP